MLNWGEQTLLIRTGKNSKGNVEKLDLCIEKSQVRFNYKKKPKKDSTFSRIFLNDLNRRKRPKMVLSGRQSVRVRARYQDAV